MERKARYPSTQRMKRLSPQERELVESHKPDDEIFSSAEIKNPSIPLPSASDTLYFTCRHKNDKGGKYSVCLTIKKSRVETPGKGRERADWGTLPQGKGSGRIHPGEAG